MDLRFPELKCPNCAGNMDGAGGSFGSRITTVKMRCNNCTLSLLIIPMKKDLEYEISATTEQERIKRIEDKVRLDLEK